MELLAFFVLFSTLLTQTYQETSAQYPITDSGGFGRTFDGVGGLSGGGATSKLIINYKEPYRTQILDYLFKPFYGASLQILKVEIGGDDQSSDGSESSHMHTEHDENYQHGYEWWLMKEAKKRNSRIKLYGLPWSFPGWIGGKAKSPYGDIEHLSDYLVKWVVGAQRHHNLSINYLGIWNERPYNTTAIKALRKKLDQADLHQVKLIETDSAFPSLSAFGKEVLADKELADAVAILGQHYPGTISPVSAKETGKPIWSSEDYSTFNDNVGGGCWARILNWNYVNGLMTSTISWNLIAGYYNHLAWTRDGLMTANEPWSGHYQVQSPIWVTAHTTQFTEIGWKYLSHGKGVGHLSKGGTYVSFTNKTDLTVVIETMTHDHSKCVRPSLPPYNVTRQSATFKLGGSFRVKIVKLYTWITKLKFGDNETASTYFERGPDIQVNKGIFSVHLLPDLLLTITTLPTGKSGNYPEPPKSKDFPVPYRNNFENYGLNSEPYNFAQQIGVFEIHAEENGNQIMKQVITEAPISWCGSGRLNRPLNIIGNFNWKNISISSSLLLPSEGAEGGFVAARVSEKQFGCESDKSTGIFFWILPTQHLVVVSTDLKMQTMLKKIVKQELHVDTWYNLTLMVEGDIYKAWLGGEILFSDSIPANISVPSNGFVAVGTSNFGIAHFNNFTIF